MIHASNQSRMTGPRAELFDLEQVGSLLRDEVSWPWASNLRDVILERCWPSRNGGYVFEWSFAVPGQGRRTLFGQTGQDPSENGSETLRTAQDTDDGIRDVRVSVPSWGLLLHTPDRDPRLPQLGQCLDGERMEDLLNAVLARMNGGQAVPFTRIACRLLGYRPGRRAAIAYCDTASEARAPLLIGKTYVDDRGERLALLHTELNEQITHHSDRQVKVPSVVDMLPDLHMSLFDHSRGRAMDDTAWWAAEDAVRAADSLAALHRCVVPGLRIFSIQDEFDVTKHWHSVLQRLNPPMATATRPILEALSHLSSCVNNTRRCMVHRDFHEGQLLIGRRVTTLLDLDTLALSHPCLDLGNLLAHLYLDRWGKGRSRVEFDELSATVIHAYESRMPPVDPRALSFYTASSLCRVGAVHAMRTRTGRFSMAMWDLAEEVLLNAYRRPGTRGLGFLESRISKLGASSAPRPIGTRSAHQPSPARIRN